MPSSDAVSIAIIGAGFSGTAVALQLVKQAQASLKPIKIYLIDRPDSTGKGLAYGTEDDNLVLNVPSGNMSVFPDRPDDFLNYCQELDSAMNSGSFMFRRVYGEYLQTRLRQAKQTHPGMLVEIADSVTSLVHDDQALAYTLQLASGSTLTASRVILSFGHFAPRSLAAIFNTAELDRAVCVDNPWDICAIDRLPLDQDVLIVGTGHTAIDTLFRLVSVPAARKIVLVSRHGHTPNGHRKAGEFVKLPALSEEIERTVKQLLKSTPTVRALFSAIRQMSYQHGNQQGNWRNVINGLRQITPQIWQALPLAERARFLRHVVYHWDVHRHRLAPVAIRRLEGLIASGRAEIVAGRISRISPVSSGLQVNIQLRGSQTMRVGQVGAIVNCTGPNYDIQCVNNDLVRRLAKVGWLQQDAMHIGFQVDESYRCSAQRHLYYIGPMLKARYWEAIAVPELRMHAQHLAKIVLADQGAVD